MNRRLEAIASMAEAGMITADIGTDHAFLPIMLVRNGKVPKAYACDLRSAPLEGAARNIEKAGLSDQISVIRSDGFEAVPSDTQCAILAGMGCETAIGIYERAAQRLSSLSLLITEVNNNVPLFRKWLSDHAFTILDEACVFEAGHWYEIISWNTAEHEPYSEEDLLLGPVNRIRNTESFQKYCTARYGKDLKLLKLRGHDTELEKEIHILQKYTEKISK